MKETIRNMVTLHSHSTYTDPENVPYHGHDITVLYDEDGSKYKVGTGFKVYVNGKLSVSEDSVGKIVVDK